MAPQDLIRLLGRLGPALIVLSIYVSTLAPTVTGEDSGELITAAYFFGVPHPPGYPLWTILCGLFTIVLPFGEVAWRANLFSAACAAIAVHVAFTTLKRMRFRPIAAGVAAVLFGLAADVWSQSVITEVYTLNLLLVAVLVWLTTRWYFDRNTKWLCWGALAFGLGMSNHHIIGFAALGLVIWAIGVQPRLLTDWRLAGRCTLLFLVGLLPYLYLPWAARRDAPVNWGETTTMAAVWEHVSRGQYKSDAPIEAQLSMTAGSFAARLFYGLRWESQQFTPYLLPLLVAGMIWLWRQRARRVWLWWVISLGVCCGPLYLYVGGPRMDRQDEFVQKVFLTPLALVSAIPLAAGLQWGMASLRRTMLPHVLGVRRRFAQVAAAGMLVIPLSVHWGDNNLRNYWYAHDHARNMLACMLPRAILIPSGDHNTFPLLYLIHVQGLRPDVTVADKYGYIDLALYEDMPNSPGKPNTNEEREEIEEWIIRTCKRPVYFTVKGPSPVEDAETVPVGLLYHLLPKGKELDTRTCWKEIRYRNLAGVRTPMDYAASNIVADYHYALGARALTAGDAETARRHFDESLRHAWGIKEIYNNVASALAEAGMVDEAIGYYEEASRMDWRYAPARWNLAKIFRSSDKLEWSAQVFRDLTQAAPGDFRPYGELGFLYADEFGDMEQARLWWYESLRLNPRQPQIILPLAESLGATGRPDLPSTQPVASAAAAGGLEFSHETIDFGEVVEGQEPTIQITLRNKGTSSLSGMAIEATCACVVGELSTTALAPSKETDLVVGLHTADKHGKITETLTIRSDDPQRTTASVTLYARVVPEMEVYPPALNWTALPKQRLESTSFTLTNHLGEAFKILEVVSFPENLEFEWRREEATCHEITVHPQLSGEAVTGTIELLTSLPDHGLVEVPFKVALRSPVRVSPPLLYLGRIERDQRIHRLVHVDAIEDGLPVSLSIKNADELAGLSAHALKTDASGATWLIQLELDGSQGRAGPISHTLLLEVEGYDQPIEVKLHGHVAE